MPIESAALLCSVVGKEVCERLHGWLPPVEAPGSAAVRLRAKALPFVDKRYVAASKKGGARTEHWGLGAEYAEGVAGQALGLPESWLKADLVHKCSDLMTLLGVSLKDSRTGVVEQFSLSGVARELGQSASTVLRKLAVLEKEGLVAVVPGNRGVGRALLCAVSPDVLTVLTEFYERGELESFVPVTSVEIRDERLHAQACPDHSGLGFEEETLSRADRVRFYRSADMGGRSWVPVAQRGRWFQVLGDKTGWSKAGERAGDFDIKIAGAKQMGQHYAFVPLSWAYLILKRKSDSCFSGSKLLPTALGGVLLTLCHVACFKSGTVAGWSLEALCRQMGLSSSSRQRLGCYLDFLHSCGVLTRRAPNFKGDCCHYELHAQVGDLIALSRSRGWLETLKEWALKNQTNEVAKDICPEFGPATSSEQQLQLPEHAELVRQANEAGEDLVFEHKGFGLWVPKRTPRPFVGPVWAESLCRQEERSSGVDLSLLPGYDANGRLIELEPQ